MKQLAIRHAWTANIVMLGLVMVIPGLLKLMDALNGGDFMFVGMLAGLGFAAPTFFAWAVLTIEILAGLAILFKFHLHYSVLGPIVILLVAVFTANWGNWPLVLAHLALVSNFVVLGLDIHSLKSP